MRIVVLGYIVRGPLGGLAWHHLQYVLGLARLGHEVLFVEDSDDYPGCYDPERNVLATDCTYGIAFAISLFQRVGLAEHWAYHDAHSGGRWLGPASTRVVEFCRSADLLLNLSGICPLRQWLVEVPARIFVDTDPVFTQIRHLTDPAAAAHARKHTAFFTFGENIATGLSTVPQDGLPWQATRQPVVLDAWPVTPVPRHGILTTVMQWDSYAARQFDGRQFGMKSASFRAFEDLPRSVGYRFELALGGDTAPAEALRALGWRVRDSREPTRDPWTYQAYLQSSLGEFGVAKHGYVSTWSGWFSERTCAYLASGRAAIVQDTGFSEWLPAGNGLFAFSGPESARAAVEEVLVRPEFHGRAARELVSAWFDSSVVLDSLLTRALNPPRLAREA